MWKPNCCYLLVFVILNILDRWPTAIMLCCSLFCGNQCLWMCWHWRNEMSWELTVFKAQQGCSDLAHTYMHSRSSVHPKILKHTHTVQMQGSTSQKARRFRKNREGKKRGERETRTSAISQNTAQSWQWLIILRSLTGLKASPDPRRDRLQ